MSVFSFTEVIGVNYESFLPNLHAFDMSRMNKESIKFNSNIFINGLWFWGKILKFEYLIECTFNVSPLRLKYVISAGGTLNYLLKRNFYKLSDIISIGTYIVDSFWWVDSIDVVMKVTLWLFLKYFLVYNSSLKCHSPHKQRIWRLDLINFVKELCNGKTRTCFQKKSRDQVDQILNNFIYERTSPM